MKPDGDLPDSRAVYAKTSALEQNSKLCRNRWILTKSIALLYGNTVFVNRPSWRSFHKEWSVCFSGTNKLDEFPEFDRRVIESLRQPLEEGTITIARAKDTLEFPACFTLICAMNPCPCGNLGSKTKMCLCSPTSLFRYKRKVSGPIADRLDLWIEVPQVDHKELTPKKNSAPTSKEIRLRVTNAREIQKKRYKKKIFTNSEMSVKDIEEFVPLSPSARNTLNLAAKNMDLSPRAYHRVIKIARTIADLKEEENIKEEYLLEALQYRPKQTEV